MKTLSNLKPFNSHSEVWASGSCGTSASSQIGRPGHPLASRRLVQWCALVLIASLITLAPAVSRADINSNSDLVEYMMDTQGLFFSVLGLNAGVNGKQTVMGYGQVDFQHGTFKWSLNAGSQFHAEALSFMMAGAMDTFGNGLNSGDGTFGGSIAEDAGNDKNSGDKADENQTITIGGKEYKVKGEIKYVKMEVGRKDSEATIEVDGKDQTACDQSTFDSKTLKWKTIWTYPCEKRKERGFKFNLNIENTIDPTGTTFLQRPSHRFLNHPPCCFSVPAFSG